MGWKGTLRSIAAAQRQAERKALKRQRELERERKRREKMLAIEQATLEVQLFQNYIDVLITLHQDCSATWDWEAIQASPPPSKPQNDHYYETLAQRDFASYKPSITDKLLKRVKTQRAKLQKAIEEGRKKDEQFYQEALKQYEQNYADWERTRELAQKILSGDTAAYLEAIYKINPFNEITQLGTAIEFNAVNKALLEVTLYVNSKDIIPRETKTLLKSGKVSIKKMPKTKFYELYQDHVCSAVLRVARESFALLPIEMVLITAEGDILNTKTGYLEKHPILSVAIPKDTLQKLNFDMLDPSDAMENFLHTMKFRKTKGFQPVEKLHPSDLQPTKST